MYTWKYIFLISPLNMLLLFYYDMFLRWLLLLLVVPIFSFHFCTYQHKLVLREMTRSFALVLCCDVFFSSSTESRRNIDRDTERMKHSTPSIVGEREGKNLSSELKFSHKNPTRLVLSCNSFFFACLFLNCYVLCLLIDAAAFRSRVGELCEWCKSVWCQHRAKSIRSQDGNVQKLRKRWQVALYSFLCSEASVVMTVFFDRLATS